MGSTSHVYGKRGSLEPMAHTSNRKASHPSRRALLLWSAALILTPLLATTSPASAKALRVTHLTLFQMHHVYYLRVGLHVGLSRSAQHALHSGIPLLLKLRIHVNHRDAWFWQGPLATLTERFLLQDHVLTGRFVVQDLNSGSRLYFRNLSAALRSLDSERKIPVIDRSLLHQGNRYRIRVKAILDIEDIPSNLRWVAWIWSDWRTSSHWQSAPLKP